MRQKKVWHKCFQPLFMENYGLEKNDTDFSHLSSFERKKNPHQIIQLLMHLEWKFDISCNLNWHLRKISLISILLGMLNDFTFQ